MGFANLTINQSDCLLWLGRYTERVYTTVRYYYLEYDHMIDETADSYAEYCLRMDIPNVYTSKEDFLSRYPFDESNPDSIRSNLNRAYDNAILLRGQIGTDAFSYIQLAIYDMNRASVSHAPFVEMQDLMDHILAFWGCVDDAIDSEKTRNILKTGKRIERLDIFARMRQGRPELMREVHRLTPRLQRSGLAYDPDDLNAMADLIQKDPIDYVELIAQVESLLQHG